MITLEYTEMQSSDRIKHFTSDNNILINELFHVQGRKYEVYSHG